MISVEQFLDLAQRASLLPDEAVESLRTQAHDTVRQLAEQLVADQRLTEYQACVLLQGTTEGLGYDEYVVIDKLGSGAMAVVLKARHSETGELVALKVMLPNALTNPEAHDRFVRECEVGTTLRHKHLVAVYGSRLSDKQKFLVMEYVDGPDLETLVAERGPFPIPEAVDYVLQAADGLAYAHAHGIIHRDIKPRNLLVNSQGELKILDLGLVRVEPLTEPAKLERLTQREAVLGTPHYMAPEQFLDCRNADAQADVYSLGCTMYHLLTAKRPYDRATPMETLRAHLTDTPPQLAEYRFDIPDKLEAVFAKMIAKQTRDRYQTMEEVIAALTPFSPAAQRSSMVRRWLGKLRGQ